MRGLRNELAGKDSGGDTGVADPVMDGRDHDGEAGDLGSCPSESVGMWGLREQSVGGEEAMSAD